jgi:DNA-binding CsgD family transcriptional regulator
VTDDDPSIVQATGELAVIVAELGGSGFSAAVLALLQAIVPCDDAAVFLYGRKRKPRCIADASQRTDLQARFKPYLAGTYLLDPFYIRSRNLKAPALLRMVDIAPQDFEASAYYVGYYKHGGVLDEINLLVPLEPGRVFAVCLERSTESRAFGADEIEVLRSWLVPLSELVRRHAELSGGLFPEPQPDVQTTNDRELSHVLADFAAQQLTPREHEVVLRMLEGEPPGDIGTTLGVSVETVRVHRRNIYVKLGISSLAELFALAMRHVIEHVSGEPETSRISAATPADSPNA